MSESGSATESRSPLLAFLRDEARRPSSRQNHPNIEPLEWRYLLSVGCPVISGYVFLDENSNPALTNNGLLDPGELIIPNAQVVLEDANHNVIETTTTDANGYYQFQKMPNTTGQTTTSTQTVTVPSTLTNFSNKALSPNINLFDPSLGTLTSVTISHSVTFNSTVNAQNLSQNSSADITASLSGTYQLNVLNTPYTGALSTSQGPVTSGPYDPSNPDANKIPPFLLSQADAPAAVTLTDAADLAFFTSSAGRTTLTSTLSATGSGTASAPNGNLSTSAVTAAFGSVTITYTYIAKECIQPGQYYLVQTPLVPNVTDGKASENGVVFPNPGSPQTLALAVGTTDLPNNDFGKLTPEPPPPPPPPPTPPPTPPAPCPTVDSLVRYGVHHQQTQLVLTFSGVVDASKASNPANYYVFSSAGQYIPIKSATYDPTTNSVTLIPQRQINVHYHFDLSVMLPCANGCTSVVVPFGGKESLAGFTNHQGQFVSVQNGHIVGTGSAPTFLQRATSHTTLTPHAHSTAVKVVAQNRLAARTSVVDTAGLGLSDTSNQTRQALRQLILANRNKHKV